MNGWMDGFVGAKSRKRSWVKLSGQKKSREILKRRETRPELRVQHVSRAAMGTVEGTEGRS